MKKIIYVGIVFLCLIGIGCEKKDAPPSMQAKLAEADDGMPTEIDGYWYGTFPRDGIDYGGWCEFRRGVYNTEGNPYGDERGSFFLEQKEKISYINLKVDGDIEKEYQFGVLNSRRRLFLYDRDILRFCSEEGWNWDGFTPNIYAVRTSSYLIEQNMLYDGKSFIIYKEKSRLLPWIEGVSGSGEGEWIELDINGNPVLDEKYYEPVKSLLVANGYISFENPSLYAKNNRVKGYRITSDKLAVPIIGELVDIPALQEIVLPDAVPCPATLRFEIISVYKGDIYDDTCISLIYPLPPDLTGKHAPH